VNKKKYVSFLLLVFCLLGSLSLSDLTAKVAKKTASKKNRSKIKKNCSTIKKITKKQQDQKPLVNTEEQPEKVPFIRVLLEEVPAANAKKISIAATKGFVFQNPSKTGTMTDFPEEEAKFVFKNSNLYFKCSDEKYRKVKNGDLEILPTHGQFKLDSRTYDGFLLLKIDPQTKNLLIINQLDLDAYIYSVLRFETVPSWPLEMHKAQAVASRSYAMFFIEQARRKDQSRCFYDIKNTNYHQIYNGAHNCLHLWEAVKQTQNLIMTYNGQPVFAMFDICCGSAVPGDMRYRNRDKPYLCRSYACPYCQRSTAYYRWNQRVGKNKLLDSFKNNPKVCSKFNDFGSLLDMQIVDKDAAGIAHKVKLFGSKKKVILTTKELKACFPLKSMSITSKKEHNDIVISGKGYGHQTGLCQWGAKELAERGWEFKKILDFYYPGIRFAKIV
jgi:stage II sporulation protein D